MKTIVLRSILQIANTLGSIQKWVYENSLQSAPYVNPDVIKQKSDHNQNRYNLSILDVSYINYGLSSFDLVYFYVSVNRNHSIHARKFHLHGR